jgi:hypothetical protein
VASAPECTEWTDEHHATFRIRHGVDEWRVAISVDPDTGEVLDEVVTITPPSTHRFDVSVPAQP